MKFEVCVTIMICKYDEISSYGFKKPQLRVRNEMHCDGLFEEERGKKTLLKLHLVFFFYGERKRRGKRREASNSQCISGTVEPHYNEVLTMKITLLYQVSHYIRVKKHSKLSKSWDQQSITLL